MSNLVLEDRRIVDQDGRSLVAEFAERRLPSLGCFFGASNRHFPSAISSESVVNAGVLISLVLKGMGMGGPWGESPRLHYGDNTLLALAVRTPTRWWSRVPGGVHVQAIGLAFPAEALERLNLWHDFARLFGAAAADVVTVAMTAGPRLQAIAAEMITPPLSGNLGRVLLEAHATEVLAYSMAALASGKAIPAINVNDRMRLHALCVLINSNLRRTWSVAELAKEAGLSKRVLNAKFRMAFGVTVFDYLKRQRLEYARDALVHQGLTVAEAAYGVGYDNPANFATAFRRYFGYQPSACRRRGVAL